MHVKRTASIVVGGGALAAWLAGAATSNHALPDPTLSRPATIDARGADLAGEIAKLHERLRPSTVPRTPGRNLFTFRPVAAAPRQHEPAAARAVLTEAPVAPSQAAQPSLKLSGIAEDPGADGAAVRLAFISGDGQLFMVKEGDAVTARYRVEKIASDGVDLRDLADDTIRHIALR